MSRQRGKRQRPGKRRAVRDHNEMGVYFYSRGAYDLAIAELMQALKAAVFPTPALHVNLGAAYLGKKNYAEARACFERSLALDPGDQKARWFLAQTLKAAGAFDQALTEFERTYALNPETLEGRSAHEEMRVLRMSLEKAEQ